MRSRALFFCAIVAAGCGGGGLDQPGDGSVSDGQSGDSMGPPPCDYDEALDESNAQTPEPSAIVLGSARVSICGMAQLKGDGTFVEVDKFGLASSGARDVLVRITAPGSEVDDLRLTVSSKGAELGAARFLVSHGVLFAAVPDGALELTVEASAGAEVVSFAYRLDVVEIDRTETCPPITTAADYDEADETADGHRANDMVAVRATGTFPRSLTAVTTDAPEATGLVLSENTQTLLTGSSAQVASSGDDYLDRDTFLFSTGSKVNELTIRLNWAGTGADLDFFVFPAGNIEEVVAGTVTALSEDELEITSVEPSSSYWLWVGAFTGSTGLPESYSISICAAEYRPLY